MSTRWRVTDGPGVTLPATDVSHDVSHGGWDAEATGRQSMTSPAIDWDACYVYIAWSHDRSRPLYVGKSREPLNRIGRHLRSTAWGSSVVEWELIAFDSEQDALRAEARAIYQLDPIHNIARGGSGGSRTRKVRPRNSLRRPMPAAHKAIPKPIHGISDDQLKIIRQVQGRRGRAA